VVSRLNFIKSKKILIPLLVVFVLIVVASSAFAFMKFNENKSTTAGSDKEIQEVTEKVSKLIDVPEGETPQLATVSDINKLKGEPFFSKAMNGDKVLLFPRAQKAIIYRPSEDKIIEVAFFNPNQTANVSQAPSENSPSVSPTQAAKIKVAVYNGTKTAGLAKSVGDRLSSKIQNIEISSTANASGNYEESMVIDLSGKNKSLAQSIASEVKGEVGPLPAGENRPSADILVILGTPN
jgi:hypothetical protein